MKMATDLRKFRNIFAGFSMAALLMGSAGDDCDGKGGNSGTPDPIPVAVSFYDFCCIFSIDWPYPRRSWTDSDKSYATATVRLRDPAPCNLKIKFKIKGHRLLRDSEMGEFWASFQEGEQFTQTDFWLVCTKQGKIKGNTGRDDDGHAIVYIDCITDSYESGCKIRVIDIYNEHWEHESECRTKMESF